MSTNRSPTTWPEHLLTAATIVFACVTGAWILAYWLGPPLQCFGDCANIPVVEQPANSHDYMKYQPLTGDIGPLGAKLYPFLWLLPVVPAALFILFLTEAWFTASIETSTNVSVKDGVGTFLANVTQTTPPAGHPIQFDSFDATFNMRHAAVPEPGAIRRIATAITAFVVNAAAGLVILNFQIGPLSRGILIFGVATFVAVIHLWVLHKIWASVVKSYRAPTTAWVFLFAFLVACFHYWTAIGFIHDTLAVRTTFTPSQRSMPDALIDSSPGKPILVFQPLSKRIENQAPRDSKESYLRLVRWHEAINSSLTPLIADGLPTAAQLRVIRTKMAELTRDEENIIAQNICRTGWYITTTVLCIAISVLGVRRRGTWSRLGMVLTSFLAVGLAFGVLYYDYYLLDAARFNALLDITALASPARAEAIPPSPEKDDLLRFAGKLAARARANKRLVRVMASGFFSSSVFAQDTPEVAHDADAPEETEALLACTFQFEENSPAIENTLSHSRRRKDFVATKLENETMEARERVCGAEVSKGLAIDTATVDDTTNAGSMARLTRVICAEAVRDNQLTDRGYKVAISAGADCQGGTTVNEALSNARGEAARTMVGNILNKVVTAARLIGQVGEPSDASAELKEKIEDEWKKKIETVTEKIRSGDESAVTQLPEHKLPHRSTCDDASTRRLWPGADWNQVVDPEAKPGRAAAVEMWRKVANVDNSVHMQTGLTENSTLSDMVYFSFVTFTTTGYGDMKAVSGPVRFCVIVENILELLFTAIFFAAAMAVVTRE